MNYYDVTYRDEGSNIYQSIIVQASRSELAEQYVKRIWWNYSRCSSKRQTLMKI